MPVHLLTEGATGSSGGRQGAVCRPFSNSSAHGMRETIRIGTLAVRARRRPEPVAARLTALMPTFLRAVGLGGVAAALVACLCGTVNAAPQEANDLPLDRIREDLKKTPAMGLKFNTPVKVPVATFKSRVEQRVYVLTLREWLDKEFALNPLQRQSADWAANCCGYALASGAQGVRLDPLFNALDRALERRRVRNIRKQIARELTELEAARTKAAVADKQ
jgi:hypothetical protein